MRPTFEDIFASEYGAVNAYIARRLGISAAEEVTAEVFAIAYRQWSDLDPSRPVRPWLYGIASNLLKHYWRRERRMLRAYARSGRDPAFGDADSSVDRLDALSAGQELAAALARLPHAELDVLLLYAWAELSDAQISEAIGVPLGTVKSRLSRARQHMRNHLGLIGKEEVETSTNAKEL